MGLISPGGVHSHQTHIAALARILDGAGLDRSYPRVSRRPRHAAAKRAWLRRRFRAQHRGLAQSADRHRVRALLRDGPRQALGPGGESLCRDRRRPRRRGFPTPKSAIAKSYEAGVTDEFVIPCVIGDYAGVRDGDALLFANFRPDRAREISTALLDRQIRRVSPPARAEILGRCRPDRIFRAAEEIHDRAVSARGNHGHTGRTVRRARVEAIAHRRDGKISARHLLHERRARDAIRRRGPHPHPEPQGRDLRSEAGHVRLRGHGQARRSHRFGQIRPHHRQLRQSRHGRAYRRDEGRRSKRSKRSTSAWAVCARPSKAPAVYFSLPPITAISS